MCLSAARCPQGDPIAKRGPLVTNDGFGTSGGPHDSTALATPFLSGTSTTVRDGLTLMARRAKRAFGIELLQDARPPPAREIAENERGSVLQRTRAAQRRAPPALRAGAPCARLAQLPTATRDTVSLSLIHTPPTHTHILCLPRIPRALQPPKPLGLGAAQRRCGPAEGPVSRAGPGQAAPGSAGGCVGGDGPAAPRRCCRYPAPSEHADPLHGCGGQRLGSRWARRWRGKGTEAKRGNPGQRPLPLPSLAWLGSVARKT